MGGKYLTIKETSDYSRFCESVVRQWTRQPDFYPAIRIGRRIVIDREAFDRWMQEQASK